MKFEIITLGCRVNQFESEAIADSCLKSGMERVRSKARGKSEADVLIINSCALTKLAEAKTRNAARNFIRNNPNVKICITGCCAQASAENLAKIDGVKWIVGNSKKFDCARIIKENPLPDKVMIETTKMWVGGKTVEERICEIKTNEDKSVEEKQSRLLTESEPISERANLKIQDGCDNFCSYCIIPRLRGAPRSRRFDDILADAHNLVGRGVREIIVTGINIAKFKGERGGTIELIDELNRIDGLYRLRLGSLEAAEFPIEEAFERMSDPAHKLMPHIHISAQSLCDDVLRLMRRKDTFADFRKIAERAAEKKIALGTDLICGHPGESEEMFQIAKKRLEQIPLSYAHIFTFSARPLTVAANMPNRVNPYEAKARADMLRTVAGAKHFAYASEFLGKEEEVLLEKPVRGIYPARTRQYLKVMVPITDNSLINHLAIVRIGKIDEDGTLRAVPVKIL